MTTFADCRRLFQAYAALAPRLEPGVLSEVKFKLEHLDYLLGRVREFEAGTTAISVAEAGVLVKLYAECFYYVGARLLDICEKQLGLGDFTRLTVRLIRNVFIEHPDRRGGGWILGWSWRHDDGRGPTLNAEQRSDARRKIIDPGLYRNAEKMRVKLEQALRLALVK